MLIFAKIEDKEHCTAHINRGEPGRMTRVQRQQQKLRLYLLNKRFKRSRNKDNIRKKYPRAFHNA
jgi:hypothetical protein